MTEQPLAITPAPRAKEHNLETRFTDGVLMNFSKDETIIDGLDEPKGVYLIKKGFVKAYTITKDGQENLLLIHDVGEFIPLIWALDGTHTDGLCYQAMSDVTVLRTSKERLHEVMSTDIWLSQELLKQSVSIISVYGQRIQSLELRSARERIIAELLHLSEMFGKRSGNIVLIDAPITHQDIANSISMTRETASRALGLLFEEGLVSQEDHNFIILDIDNLQAELGYQD